MADQNVNQAYSLDDQAMSRHYSDSSPSVRLVLERSMRHISPGDEQAFEHAAITIETWDRKNGDEVCLWLESDE